MREINSILEGLHTSRVNEGGLKLADLEKVVKERLKKLDKDRLVAYANDLKARGGYKQFDVRFVNDVKSALFKPDEICDWYDTYGCTDKHITSLFLKVMKEYEKQNKINLYLNESVSEGVIDETRPAIEYHISKSLLKDVKDKYAKLNKILARKEYTITELCDAIDKAFKLVGGSVNIYKQSQTYVRIDGKVKAFTIGLGIGTDGFELPMLAEDLTVGYFKSKGGESHYTPDFIKFINGKEPDNGSIYVVDEAVVDEVTHTTKDFDELVKASTALRNLYNKFSIADGKDDVKAMADVHKKMQAQLEGIQDIIDGLDEVMMHLEDLI